MKLKPVIAVPITGTGLFKKYMMGKYEQSLIKSGADVKWTDLSDVDEAVKTALECDGLLLPGGADVSPELYGEKKQENCGETDAVRDKAEPELYKAFIAAGKPVLAICRGIQLINVIEGGTLLQDISEIKKCPHMSVYTKNSFCHAVKLADSGILSDIYKLPAIPVNSMHHQAINEVSENFKVTAVSEDGITEGIEKKDYPFCVGVQWHPEHMYMKNPLQRRLFDAFVAACAKE